MKNYSRNINIMLKTAEKTYSILQRDYREIELLQSSSRGSEDFANKTAKKITSIISESFSKISDIDFFGDISEFANHPKNNSFYFGLDGFKNFERAIPTFSLTFAYINYLGEVESALIFCPALLEYYIIETKKGAWKEAINGSGNTEVRLKISNRPKTSQIYISSAFCQLGKISLNLEKNNISVLNCESLSIAYFASGKFDIYYLSNSIFFRKLSKLFVQETSSFIQEEKDKFIIYSNNNLNSILVDHNK